MTHSNNHPDFGAAFHRRDTDPVAYYYIEKDKDAREKLVLNVMYRRPYDLVCNDPIRDDF